MKLQYRCGESFGFKIRIELYQDGKFVESYKVYLDDLDDEISALERKGYARGYTQEEVIKAKLAYEKILKNIIQ